MSGCNGDCCAVFFLPYTISEMRRRAPTLRDGQQIAEMVIPLTPKEARERREQLAPGSIALPIRWRDRGHHFTCRHWDPETRLCGIYEDRPTMCRTFPDGDPCEHGCDCVGEARPDGVEAHRYSSGDASS